jgi:hypothetical protein
MWARAEALDLVCGPTLLLLLGVLNACASIVALDEGKCSHEQIIQSGVNSNGFLGSSLVDTYATCGSMEYAWTVFNKIPSGNVVFWNAILGGCDPMGMEMKLFNILDEYVKKVQSQMTSLKLFVFCQFVGFQVWWMKECTAMVLMITIYVISW